MPSVHLLAIAGGLDVEFTLARLGSSRTRRAAARRSHASGTLPHGAALQSRRDACRAAGARRAASMGRPRPCPAGPFGAQIADAERFGDDVIRPAGVPHQRDAGLAVLCGNLAPDGAILKPAAASAHLLRHAGRAVVFESIEDFKARIDDPALDVDADSVLVLKGCGPRGYPGMPEVGNMPIPRKLLERGITDMVRVSDARMSGTAYGTVRAPMWHPSRRPAVRWDSCAAATSSCWTSRRGSCGSRWTTPRWSDEQRRGLRPHLRTRAATHGCTSTMSSKRTAGPTSTSSSVPAAQT